MRISTTATTTSAWGSELAVWSGFSAMTSSEGKSLIGISPPAGEVTEVGGKSQTRPFLAGLPADPPVGLFSLVVRVK